MKAFVWSLETHLGNTDTLFSTSDDVTSMSRDAKVTTIAQKLDTLVQHLNLTPFTPNGTLQGWLTPISKAAIQPVWLLCPMSAECETNNCQRALRQVIRERDVSQVTLCEGTEVYHKVVVLSGFCPVCKVCAWFMCQYSCSLSKIIDTVLC